MFIDFIKIVYSVHGSLLFTTVFKDLICFLSLYEEILNIKYQSIK